MAAVTFRFVEPNSWVGRVICWRLGEPWSHVSIVFHDCAFSAQVPHVVCYPLDHREIAIPPRVGKDIILTVTDEEEARMRAWCQCRVGQNYDFLAILGWFMGWSWLQSRRNTYCFEYVRECLQHMGWLQPYKRLIKGNRLIEDIDGLLQLHVIKPAEAKGAEVRPVVEVDYQDQAIQSINIVQST